MSFIADKQTTDDLNLLGKHTPNSIYSIFNKVKTPGGERLLDAMFRQPLTDENAINRRSTLFRYFQEKELVFPFQSANIRIAEDYLASAVPSGKLQAVAGVLRKKIIGVLLHDEQYAGLQAGLQATIAMLNTLYSLLCNLDVRSNNIYYEQATKIIDILGQPRLSWLSRAQGRHFSVMETAMYDFMLRYTFRKEMELVLACIYELDVYISVSNVAAERRFSYAVAYPSAYNLLKAAALQHPALEKAVANPISLHSEQNVLFLTGANMAGKSTFMKSLGIAVYLAHMGFPLAAKDMQFSVRNGLYSSINVADNLNMGYSHFYAEVLRVKKAAEQVSQGNNMVVIFDELFKGTNVKDAYDATLAVTSAFSKYHNCLFVISTHIIEVGEAMQNNTNLKFAYLPTIMKGNVPKYTYTLTDGISSDRHGMMIVQNEGILELIRGIKRFKTT